MSLRELPTQEAAQRMAQASIHLDVIASNPATQEWVERNKGKKISLVELLRLVSIVLNECYTQARAAVAILAGKTEEDVDSQPLAATLTDIDTIAGGKLLSFFSSSSGTEQGE